MSGIILCRSKYGASAKYAEWISEETGFKVVDTKNADIKEVAKFDTVIIGGGVYASSIGGIAFLKKNYAALKGKQIIVYSCGAAPYDDEILEIVRNKNLKGELADIPCFYFQGMWDLEGMNFTDKAMCKMYVKMLDKKDPSTIKAWEKPFLEAKDKKCDWTDKKYLEPLFAELRKGEKS
ncbi:MAG: flavodoxin [Ruminococcus sp.]|nr:flavodoxin [Ruminococcus sp.]